MLVQAVKYICMKNKWVIALIIILAVVGWFVFSNDNDGQNNSPQNINARVGTNIGDVAPEFSFTTIDGETISSEDLKGRAVVITSSASWCSTCVAEALQFAAVYPQVNTDQVYFLTIDIDPNVTDEVIQQFRTKTSTPWDYASARGGSEAIRQLKLNRFEITYVINADGIITYKDQRITDSEELNAAIHSALSI